MLKYIARVAAIIFFLLGLIGTVYIIRILYGAYTQSDMQKKWIQIPTPDETLVTLKVDNAGEILAEGADGGTYQFSLDPVPAWVNVKDVEKVDKDPAYNYIARPCKPITNSAYQPEPMSNKVKIQASIDCGFSEQAIYYHVDLLENGETWYSKKTSNSYATVGMFVLVPIGVIINIALYVTGLFFFALDVILTLRRKSNQAA